MLLGHRIRPLLRPPYRTYTLHMMPTPTPTLTPPSPPPLRVLLLHGYTQSGPLFRAKTRALEKSLSKLLKSAYPTRFSTLEFTYPTAPLRIRPADIPGFDAEEAHESECYGWWIRRGEREPFTYAGIEEGLAAVADVLKEAVAKGAVYDGVVGFSQGGALAGMVASLLEGAHRREAFERLRLRGGMAFPGCFLADDDADADGAGGGGRLCHPPLKFAVSYSGFGATTNALYMPFYEPKIETPVLHFLGSVDTVVEEERSMRLVRSCADGGKGRGGRERVVRHPGGHFLPSGTKPWVGILAEFVGECMGWDSGVEGGKGEGEGEERVEDMEVPF